MRQEPLKDKPRWIALASRALTGVGALALVVMTLWTVVDVLTRYVLSKPLAGSIDLVEVTLVLVVFLALPECFRRGEQVTVDVVDHLAGPDALPWLKLLAALATIAFLGLLLYTGIQPLVDAWTFGDRKPDLPIPLFALLAVIELAIGVSLIVLLTQFFHHLRGALRREAP